MRASLHFLCLLVVAASLLGTAFGYATNNRVLTCKQTVPEHGTATYSTPAPDQYTYSVTGLSSGGYLTPSSTITITLKAPSTTNAFKGFHFAAYADYATGTLYGTSTGSGFKDSSSYVFPTQQCPVTNQRDIMVSASNISNTQLSVKYITPGGTLTKNLTFVATIVKNYDTFYKIVLNTLMPAPDISVTAPAANSMYLVGSTITTTWTNIGAVSPSNSFVSIGLINALNDTRIATYNVSNTGSFSLTTTKDMLLDKAVFNLTVFNSSDSKTVITTKRTNSFVIHDGNPRIAVIYPGNTIIKVGATIESDLTFINCTASSYLLAAAVSRASDKKLLYTFPNRIYIYGYNTASKMTLTFPVDYDGPVYLNFTMESTDTVKQKVMGQSSTFSLTLLNVTQMADYSVKPNSTATVTWTSRGYNATKNFIALVLVNLERGTSVALPAVPDDGSETYFIPGGFPSGYHHLNVTSMTTTSTGQTIPIASGLSNKFYIASISIKSQPGPNAVFIVGNTINIAVNVGSSNSNLFFLAELRNASNDAVISSSMLEQSTSNTNYQITATSNLRGGLYVYFYLRKLDSTLVTYNQTNRFYITDRPVVVFSTPSTNGDYFLAGTSIPAVWSTPGIYDPTTVSYMVFNLLNVTNNNATVFTWSNVPNTGSANLTLSSWVGRFGLEGIAYHTNGTVLATNKSPPFYISGPFFNVTGPRGAIYPVGTRMNVTWSSFAMNTTNTFVRIVLVNATKNSTVFVYDKLANNGSYLLPKYNMTGKFFFTVSMINTTSGATISNNRSETFAWTHYVFSSPTYNQVLLKGSTYNLLWNSTLSNKTNVKLDFVKNSTQVVTNIISSTPNDGNHTWTVSKTAPSANDYYILTTSLVNNTNRGQSYFFTLANTTLNFTSGVQNDMIYYRRIEHTYRIDFKKSSIIDSSSYLQMLICYEDKTGCQYLNQKIHYSDTWYDFTPTKYNFVGDENTRYKFLLRTVNDPNNSYTWSDGGFYIRA
eukprot:TRINITY_DN11365_c0_g1::TRINITY_DN11365_c0_g1_i1::g.26349::m.26349 TRINITY_DN11365_c0_g1::TRINITY_DN11365_c0_g1_i1::g.26349  ORF type:complete len:1025 (+),score=228.97,GPI-anchored/PF10342.4/1.9e+03,GPI-anchored/PF10342.4/0.37,GPI-anchored/PF10342.4/2.7e+03,GPI-anchored/PF10342.4/3.6,GPI-anchored/PF10342.4/0.23,GPI-anchored/PF10342.4/31,GPI-anchored/PF10342.4/1.2,GPI-anchored/PF10342.4/6.3e-06,GPI-anchored/PF10342.4/1.6e+03,Reeler/PF02014.11/2.1e-06,Reeler/PF02014.11/4.9e+03,Reeler/PF02014.11/1.